MHGYTRREIDGTSVLFRLCTKLPVFDHVSKWPKDPCVHLTHGGANHSPVLIFFGSCAPNAARRGTSLTLVGSNPTMIQIPYGGRSSMVEHGKNNLLRDSRDPKCPMQCDGLLR